MAASNRIPGNSLTIPDGNVASAAEDEGEVESAGFI
jgi:hypothetical protein